MNDIGPVERTNQPSRLIVFFAVAAIAFLAGALVVGTFGTRQGQLAVAPSGQPSPSPSPSVAPSRSPLAVHCGPLATDLATCFAVIAATAPASDDPSKPTTDVFVAAGSTRAWCAPPAPCISPPPDSYWVTLDSGSGGLSVPVYLGPDGWVVGVPAQ